jgi:hypothetical protein
MRSVEEMMLLLAHPQSLVLLLIMLVNLDQNKMIHLVGAIQKQTTTLDLLQKDVSS